MTREEAIGTMNYLKHYAETDIKERDVLEEKDRVRFIEALEMAIQALSQVTKVRKLILQAERSGVHLDYGAYKFMNALEKVVGEKQIGEFEQEPCDDVVSIEAVIEWLKEKDFIKMNWQEKNARKELQEYFSVTQKPCDDAISRDAVIKAIDAHTNEDGTLDDDISVILEDLPPVTQKPKYWIDKDNKLYKMPDDIPSVTQKSGKWVAYADGIWIQYYECSKCGKRNSTHSDYCPNCGAKMVEPQESEDEE